MYVCLFRRAIASILRIAYELTRTHTCAKLPCLRESAIYASKAQVRSVTKRVYTLFSTRVGSVAQTTP